MFKIRLLFFSAVLLFVICFSFNAGAIQKMGYCGENLTYIYDSRNKSVTIGGSGDMYDYAEVFDSPFYNGDIVSVLIEDGVTSIGSNAFFGSQSLKYVVMSDSVTTIGNRAFDSCLLLSEISFSQSMSYIGESAFFGCESLTDVVFTNETITLSDGVFEGCSSLSDAVFLSGVKEIGENVFSYCEKLSEIHISADEENVSESVIKNVPLTIAVHIVDYNETVIDCLSGEVKICAYCDACDTEIYQNEIIKQYDSHLFTEYTSDNNSLCLVDGTKTAVCERCLTTDTVTDVGSATGHSWDVWKKHIVETCNEEGQKYRKCLNCDAFETETIPAISHCNSYLVKETKPTCTVNGYEEGVFCPDCDTWLSGHGTINAPGHTGGISGCTQKAVCSRCGEVYGVINSNKHLNITVFAGKDATCSENGFTESKVCSDCKKVIKAKQTIPSKGHVEIEISGIGATCTKAGATVGKKCSACGIIITAPKKISAKGHKVVTLAGVVPTCTKSGLSASKKCSSCNLIIEKAQKIPAKGHTKTDIPGVEATCTRTGLSGGKKCSACGIIITAPKEIPLKSHKETVLSAVESTCTKEGLTEGKKCVSCKKITLAQKKTPLKKHNYKIVLVKKATLTDNGKTVYQCFCGAKKPDSSKKIYSPKTISLSAISYTYNSNVKTPSVTVKDSKGAVLKKGVDYVVKYESGRKTPGRYTVKITFQDKYSGTKKLYFTIAPKITNKVKASQQSSSITLEWNSVTGADGYRVYMYDSKTKKYKKVKDVIERSLKVTGLDSGRTYKFKVKAFRKDGGTIWGKATAAYAFATEPAPTRIVSCSENNATVSLKWKKVSGASGYVVYRYSSGKWQRIKTITSGARISCKIEGLKSGTEYKFRIKSYKKSGGSTLWGAFSASVSVITTPAAPKLDVTSPRKGCASIKWSNVTGESGYQVYYSPKEDSGFVKLATTKADITKIIRDNLKSGATYYFKVRSYKKTGDSVLFSAWSYVYPVTIK